jgi:RimJ/RimL family protein N-acetyltransferase
MSEDTGAAGVTVRPLRPGELGRFLDLGEAGYGPPERDFLATAGEGHYRPEWTWVAERDGRVVARAAWYGAPDDDHPIALDWFDVAAEPDRVAVGGQLLGIAHRRVRAAGGALAEYHLFLPPDWRDRPDVVAEVDARRAAASEAGLRPFVERLRVEWTAAAALPAGTGRLSFAPIPPGRDGELLDLLARINEGTLDVFTQRDIERSGAAAAAREQLDGMLWMPGPRDWWRLALLPGGDVVGVVMPSRNYQSFVIGYVGVVPEHRGRGYAGDLVAEGTSVLVAQGADRVVADTDTGNRPMASAFERAGYRVTARRLVMA